MAQRKEGYWVDVRNLESIPIYDHALWLQELEAKVRNDLDLTKNDRRHAASLGLAIGEGWGNVPKESPADRKVRFMTNAFKAGWIRLRAHSDLPRVTAEMWRGTDDALVALALALKKIKTPPGNDIEIHELAVDSAFVVKAGDLYARMRGEGSPEAEAAIGFSVYSNPSGKKLAGVRGRDWGSRRNYPAGVPVAGGRFKYNPVGEWHPLENPQLVGKFIQMNPRTLQRYVEPEKGEGETVARMFIGLKVGVGKKVEEIPRESVYKWVRDFREAQLGEAPGGASFIAQKGFFTHWEKHPAEVVDEDSLQIIFYPDGRAGSPGAELDGNYKVRGEVFAKHMHEIAPALADAFRQKEVIIHLVVNGKLDTLGSYAEE
jgi:hypothetical protein